MHAPMLRRLVRSSPSDMDLIETIAKTRATAAEIMQASLHGLRGRSESDVRDEMHQMLAERSELFESGWYDPPHGGVAALFDTAPYERLQFESLRNPESFPSASKLFDTESVGIVYTSAVDRTAGMFGDIGFTVYQGNDSQVQHHIRAVHDLVLKAAALAEVGMKFCDLYTASRRIFNDEGQKVIGWMSTTHDPFKVNLGHTAPGSYGDGPIPLEDFAATREAIRTRRLYINEVEQFAIPATCAFTVEARLTDISKTLPNAFFHVIVTFSEGEKQILTNFDRIFKTAGMDYML